MKLLNVYTFCISLTLSGLLPAQSMANGHTDKVWGQGLKEQGIAAKDQSYCYTDTEGNIQGANIDMKIRLASVSKLVTSLWVVETLGVDYKYNTKLFIKDNKLHIEGSYDPFLGNEKMFFLLSQLNELGYEKFDTITFDKNVVINPDVQYASDEYPIINSTNMAKFLKNYFNTKSWSADTKTEYENFYNLSKEGKFRKSVNFEAGTIESVEANPFLGDDTVKTLTLSSPPLYKYLKEMNVKSNNYVAETLFRQAGGVNSFQQYLGDKYSNTSDQIQFYTGSGLPLTVDNVRKDNYASCGLILNFISHLKTLVESQGKTLEDIVAVPGSDGGTFRNRIFPSDYKNAFVAKTGTLMHTSSLAGAMNTQNGFSFFGIFNQSTDIGGSKIVQNSMVKSIMSELGGPKAFDYVVEPFHAYDNDNLKMFNDYSDFSAIEGNLF